MMTINMCVMFLITTVCSLIMYNTNPIQMCLIMTAMSMLIFYQMAQVANSAWFATIFMLLFLGGILIMFMILTSVMPNKKKENKKKMTGLLILLSMTMPWIMNEMKTNCIMEMKTITMDGGSFNIMIIIVVLYFFMFVHIISTEKMGYELENAS